MNRRSLFSAPLVALGLLQPQEPAAHVIKLDASGLVDEIAKLRRELENARMSDAVGSGGRKIAKVGDIVRFMPPSIHFHGRVDDIPGSVQSALGIIESSGG